MKKGVFQMPPAVFVLSIIGLAGGSIIGDLISPSFDSFGAVFGFVLLAFVGFREDKEKALSEQKTVIARDYSDHFVDVDERITQLTRDNGFLSTELVRLRKELEQIENQISSKKQEQDQSNTPSPISWKPKPVIAKEIKRFPLTSDFSEIYDAGYVEHTRSYFDFIDSGKKIENLSIDGLLRGISNSTMQGRVILSFLLIDDGAIGKTAMGFYMIDPKAENIAQHPNFYHWFKRSIFDNNPYWGVKQSYYQRYSDIQHAQLNLIKGLLESKKNRGPINLTGEE